MYCASSCARIMAVASVCADAMALLLSSVGLAGWFGSTYGGSSRLPTGMLYMLPLYCCCCARTTRALFPRGVVFAFEGCGAGWTRRGVNKTREFVARAPRVTVEAIAVVGKAGIVVGGEWGQPSAGAFWLANCYPDNFTRQRQFCLARC